MKYKIIKPLMNTDHNNIYIVKHRFVKYIMKESEDSNEIDIAKDLDCKFIIKFIDTFYLNENFYIIMPKYDTDLFQLLADNENINMKSYFCQILLGLEYIHSNNILHNDIKPENILIKNNKCVITDFGFSSKVSDVSIKNYQEFRGTLEYSTIEMITEAGYNYKNDVYALGIILYEYYFQEFIFSYINDAQNNDIDFFDKEHSHIIDRLIEDKKKPLNITSIESIHLSNLILNMTCYPIDNILDLNTIKSHKWLENIKWNIL